MSKKIYYILIPTILIYLVIGPLIAAWQQDQTFDEGSHLSWSRKVVEHRDTSRPKKFENSKTPIIILNVLTQNIAKSIQPRNRQLSLFFARLPTSLWLLLLISVVYLTIYRITGQHVLSAIGSLGTALDPNIIAHSSVATVDAAFAFATILFLLTCHEHLKHNSWRTAIAVGIGFGFTVVVKFSAMLYTGVLLIFLPQLLSRKLFRQNAKIVGIAILAALLTINSWYLFIEIGEAFRDITFKSNFFRTLADSLPMLRLPLPTGLLTGIDISLFDDRNTEWNSVLHGSLSANGFWYYFLFLWFFKTPIVSIIALIVGCACLLRDGKWRETKVFILCGGICLIYFSFIFRTHVGYRFALMVIPIAWVLAAVGFSKLKSIKPSYIAAAASLAFLEFSPYIANPFSFTNSFILPKKSAYKFVADSNIDWNQHYAKIYQSIDRKRDHLNPFHILQGRNIISLNRLTGVMWNYSQYQWLRENLEPNNHINHTFLAYDINQDTLNRFLDDNRTLESTPLPPESICVPRQAKNHIVPIRQRVYCFIAPTKGDVILQIAKGGLLIRNKSLQERLKAKQNAIYRLKPGKHVISLYPAGKLQARFVLKDRQVVIGSLREGGSN